MRGAVVRPINSLGRVPDREVLESADEDRRNVLRVPGDSIDSSRVTSGTIGQIENAAELSETCLRPSHLPGAWFSLSVAFQHTAIEHIAKSYRAFLTSPVGGGDSARPKGQV